MPPCGHFYWARLKLGLSKDQPNDKMCRARAKDFKINRLNSRNFASRKREAYFGRRVSYFDYNERRSYCSLRPLIIYQTSPIPAESWPLMVRAQTVAKNNNIRTDRCSTTVALPYILLLDAYAFAFSTASTDYNQMDSVHPLNDICSSCASSVAQSPLLSPKPVKTAKKPTSEYLTALIRNAEDPDRQVIRNPTFTRDFPLKSGIPPGRHDPTQRTLRKIPRIPPSQQSHTPERLEFETDVQGVAHHYHVSTPSQPATHELPKISQIKLQYQEFWQEIKEKQDALENEMRPVEQSSLVDHKEVKPAQNDHPHRRAARPRKKIIILDDSDDPDAFRGFKSRRGQQEEAPVSPNPEGLDRDLSDPDTGSDWCEDEELTDPVATDRQEDDTPLLEWLIKCEEEVIAASSVHVQVVTNVDEGEKPAAQDFDLTGSDAEGSLEMRVPWYRRSKIIILDDDSDPDAFRGFKGRRPRLERSAEGKKCPSEVAIEHPIFGISSPYPFQFRTSFTHNFTRNYTRPTRKPRRKANFYPPPRRVPVQHQTPVQKLKNLARNRKEHPPRVSFAELLGWEYDETDEESQGRLSTEWKEVEEDEEELAEPTPSIHDKSTEQIDNLSLLQQQDDDTNSSCIPLGGTQSEISQALHDVDNGSDGDEEDNGEDPCVESGNIIPRTPPPRSLSRINLLSLSPLDSEFRLLNWVSDLSNRSCPHSAEEEESEDSLCYHPNSHTTSPDSSSTSRSPNSTSPHKVPASCVSDDDHLASSDHGMGTDHWLRYLYPSDEK
ncbi:hypothetical protein C8R41DRAFT_821753 [Lentinula lateritia]|uniref:Uncharacterized protein n=1 Tax=Lentinula lateritia TaxID=40482 RepID=A0ABQ8VQ93_9AGAR|nr:hypothetical protein C8R41DRAFT_821753 [Lentinula lateritia]